MDYAHDAEVEEPDAPDETVGPEFRAWARAQLESRLPAYRDLPDVGALVGMYTLSPDAQALIGPVRDVSGLVVVSGFSGHGFKLAPSIGEGVAQMLWGEPVSAFDAEFFSPDRFHGGLHEPTTASRGRGFGL
jgi:glycine/D-amino acid oxidase-like deaminating enzyme